VYADPNNPNNGRFEFFDFNDTFDINTPTGWICENYTDVVSNFIPHPEPDQGSFENWRINTKTGLFPFEGNYFLVLSTGDVRPEPTYAKVWQTITVATGDKLTGVYFFGTCDYLVYDDFGEIKLIAEPNLGLSDMTLVRISITDVGSHGSLSGWTRFEHTFEANEAGNYNLVISVNDDIDSIWDTYFAVDGLALCKNASQFGDINGDCTTNFQDFALLAADWLSNCNNPDVFNDPNSNCRLGTNLTGNGLIDNNDLQIMSEYWLDGTKQ
jgi:hypothetical protein